MHAAGALKSTKSPTRLPEDPINFNVFYLDTFGNSRHTTITYFLEPDDMRRLAWGSVGAVRLNFLMSENQNNYS